MCVFVFVCVGFETWRVSAFVCMYVCVCWVFCFETSAAVQRLCCFVGAMSVWGPASGGSRGKGPASGGSGNPASSGSRGIGPAPGGRTVVSGMPRRPALCKDPWDTATCCWSFTKGEAGARVEMKKGDWDKEQLYAEVQSHDDIIAHEAMQNKLKHSKSSDHECDTNFKLHLEGNFLQPSATPDSRINPATPMGGSSSVPGAGRWTRSLRQCMSC